MNFPHTLLTLPAAVAFWVAGSLWSGPPASAQVGRAVGNPLAVRGSAYGSLVARLMKASLNSYWHQGRNETAPGHGAEHAGEAAGRLARPHLLLAPATAATHPHAAGSWIERCTERLAELEEIRTTRNSSFAVSKAHHRYLTASADWRLRLAYELDPGDAALYEILHFTVMSHTAPPEAAHQAAEKLALQTIEHALSPQGTLAAALAGAGAAINLLNNGLQPDSRVQPGPSRLLRDWDVLEICLGRYRHLHQQAAEEGWWSDIPPTRQQEIESYAALLEKIAAQIRVQLTAMRVLSS